MFVNKKKIKELETVVENLQGHLEYSRGIVRERSAIIEQLEKELSEIKSLIAEDVISKIRIENKQGFQLIESWRITDLLLEDVYDKSLELNKQGWFTVINEDDECDLGVLYEIIVYGKADSE